jgi:hypothetical protein
MTEQLERKGDCEGKQDKCNAVGCPKFGTLGRVGNDGNRRTKNCGDPTARGKRNRAKGDSKARRARKQLGIQGANTRHEELWGGDLRVEVKSGAQVAPIWTRYLLAENQSKQAKPIGDARPFALIAMPDDTREGLVVMRLSSFAQLFGG